jgi:hypothetical protein
MGIHSAGWYRLAMPDLATTRPGEEEP